MQTEVIRTTFLLPAELHDRLATRAREAERTVSAEIRVAVREHVSSEPADQRVEEKKGPNTPNTKAPR